MKRQPACDHCHRAAGVWISSTNPDCTLCGDCLPNADTHHAIYGDCLERVLRPTTTSPNERAPMTNDNDDDARDPLRAAFADYQRPPRDIVPRRPHGLLDDLAALAGTMVEIVYYEIAAGGITRHVENITITETVTAKDSNNG